MAEDAGVEPAPDVNRGLDLANRHNAALSTFRF